MRAVVKYEAQILTLLLVVYLAFFFWSIYQFLVAYRDGDTNDLIFWGVALILISTGRSKR